MADIEAGDTLYYVLRSEFETVVDSLDGVGRSGPLKPPTDGVLLSVIPLTSRTYPTYIHSSHESTYEKPCKVLLHRAFHISLLSIDLQE